MFAKKSSKKKQESKKKNVENVGKRLKGKVSAKNAVKRQVVSPPFFMDGVCSKVVIKDAGTVEDANKLYHTESEDGSQDLFENSIVVDEPKSIEAEDSNPISEERPSGSNEPNLSRSIFAKIDRKFEEKLKKSCNDDVVQYSNEACENVGTTSKLFNAFFAQFPVSPEKVIEQCVKNVQTMRNDINEVLMGKTESQSSSRYSAVDKHNADQKDVCLLPSSSWLYHTPKKTKMKREPPSTDQPCMLKPAFLQTDSKHKILYKLDEKDLPFEQLYNPPYITETPTCKIPQNQTTFNYQPKPSHFLTPAQELQSSEIPYKTAAQYHHPPPTKKQNTGGWAPFHSNPAMDKGPVPSPELNLFSHVFNPTYEQPAHEWASFATHQQSVFSFGTVSNNCNPNYLAANRPCCSKDYDNNENINHETMWQMYNERDEARARHSPVEVAEEFVFQPNLWD